MSLFSDTGAAPPANTVFATLQRQTTTAFEQSVFRVEQKTGYPLKNRKTKIVCTIGPKSQLVPALCRLIECGMNIARMNFSHGDHAFHGRTIVNVREAVRVTGLPCALLLDTKGPEIRTGKLVDHKPVTLERGKTVTIHCAPADGFLGTSTDISVDYKSMMNVVKKGTIIKIDDGLIAIRVDEIVETRIRGTIINTHELGETKGVNLPGCVVDLPTLTRKDERDLQFGIEQKVDFLAPSFINRASDIIKIREVLGKDGAYIKIISKIESAEGLTNFDAILHVSDGIMVARGDLGVEIPIEKVCMAQKTMIEKCNAAGKPVITATQMLDSMIERPRPTNAEVGDVANAVFDGSDCVMLSGETAKGDFAEEAVSVMSRICLASEGSLDRGTMYFNTLARSIRGSSENSRTEAVTSAAVKTALDLNAALIFALTDTGRTARFVSKYRPAVPVITVTPNEVTYYQSLICSGLWPLMVDSALDDSARYDQAIQTAKQNGWCKPGDCVILVSGKQGESGTAHQLRVLDVPADS